MGLKSWWQEAGRLRPEGGVPRSLADQLRRDDIGMRGCCVAINPGQEPLCCQLPDPLGVLGDDCHAGIHHVGEREVIEPYQGHSFA